MKQIWIPILIITFFHIGNCQAQDNSENHKTKDSTSKAELIKNLGNGYFPTKYFDFDLRYLVKYNQFEGFRTGLGGLTNSNLSENFRLQGYTVYGVLDHTFKFSVGASIRLAKKTNTWLSYTHTSDLEETGSSNFLTDKRFFQFIEPRLFNIDLFHHHISNSIELQHQLASNILTETHFISSNISPTYSYNYVPNTQSNFNDFELTLAKLSVQWNPFSAYQDEKDPYLETKVGYPKITMQFTKSFKEILQGDFNFSKFDLRIFQQFNHSNSSVSQLVLASGIANGAVPLSHLYHAFPNNVDKSSIFKRFSVAGNNSFETMYFNEFFSDKIISLRFKHILKPFNFGPRFKPDLAFITKYALGSMDSPEHHQNISFKTLEHGYFESGIELNQLLIGFGLSFAYRYGAYHLPHFDDNIAFKFTFNLNLNK